MTELIFKQYESLISDIDDNISIFANTSAFIYENFNDISWSGFYFVKNEYLILGPFQGKIACTKIPFNKGVCGACATHQKTIVVEDVHQFPGHIACDNASNSEIVVPIFKDNKLFGILDLDSTSLNRFHKDDRYVFEKIVRILENYLK